MAYPGKVISSDLRRSARTIKKQRWFQLIDRLWASKPAADGGPVYGQPSRNRHGSDAHDGRWATRRDVSGQRHRATAAEAETDHTIYGFKTEAAAQIFQDRIGGFRIEPNDKARCLAEARL
jgi:hypothetical protein